MSFLTPGRLRTGFSAIALLIAAHAYLAFPLEALAQGDEGGGLSLRAGSGEGAAAGEPTAGALPWVVGVVSLTLIGVLVVTLWPNESDSNPYQRQRKFARVDGLFLKAPGRLLDPAEARRFLGELKASGVYPQVGSAPIEAVTLMSLSFGGCSIASPSPLVKGGIVLLDLGSLPDFPGRALTVAAKIVWVRARAESGEPFDAAGAKFLFPSDRTGTEELRQYLNFLMDEPLS